MRSSPVCDSASISSILRAVGIGLSRSESPRADFFGDVHGRRQIAHEASPAAMTPRLIIFVDLVCREAELGENLAGVLADARAWRRRSKSCSPISIGSRGSLARLPFWKATSSMRPPALSCGSSNRSPGLATGANGISMRSNTSASAASLCSADDGGNQRPQHRPRAHAVLIGLVGRIGQQILPREMLAEAAPLAVAGDADENLLAVGGREGLVDRPAPSRDGIGGIGLPVTTSPAMCTSSGMPWIRTKRI